MLNRATALMGMAFILHVLMILGMQVEVAADERGKKMLIIQDRLILIAGISLFLKSYWLKVCLCLKKLCFHLKHVTVFKKVIQSSASVFASIVSKEGVWWLEPNSSFLCFCARSSWKSQPNRFIVICFVGFVKQPRSLRSLFHVSAVPQKTLAFNSNQYLKHWLLKSTAAQHDGTAQTTDRTATRTIADTKSKQPVVNSNTAGPGTQAKLQKMISALEEFHRAFNRTRSSQLTIMPRGNTTLLLTFLCISFFIVL